MKKITMVLMIVLLLTVSVLAVKYGNRADALARHAADKAQRNNILKDIASEIEYTEDKICELNRHSNNFECEVCFRYLIFRPDATLFKNSTYCLEVPEHSNFRQDDKKVKEFISGVIDREYPKKDIQYIKESLKGRRINFSFRDIFRNGK